GVDCIFQIAPPARRAAKSATTLEPELWVQRCELRVTVPQRTRDDNILCNVFCASAAPPASLLGNTLQRGREGVEREGAQQVAAQPALDFAETFRGALHPGEVGGFGHFLQFSQN